MSVNNFNYVEIFWSTFSDHSSELQFFSFLIKDPCNVLIANSSFINLKKVSYSSLNDPTYQKSPLFIQFTGIYQTNNSSVTILSSIFRDNSGIMGGCFYMEGYYVALFVKNSTFEQNDAQKKSNENSGSGGVFAYLCLLVTFSCNASFLNNNYTRNYADVYSSLQYYEYVNFTPDVGSTYLNNSDKMKTNETDWSNPSNITCISCNLTNFIIKNNEETLLKFELLDSKNRKVVYDFTSIFKLIFLNSSTPNSDVPQLFNGIFNTTYQGEIYFSKFLIKGSFNTSYWVRVQLQNNDINLLFLDINILIRSCEVGEYLDHEQETCNPCPAGTYSLKIPSQTFNSSLLCQKCPAFATCSKNSIIPVNDYWRINENSTLIVKCPVKYACDSNNNDFINYKAPGNCTKGQTGELCVNCEKGYAKDDLKKLCYECALDFKNSAQLIAKLLFMIGYVIYQVYNTLLHNDEKDMDPSGVIIKILLDHIQQISLIFPLFYVWDVTENILEYFKVGVSFSIGQILLFECFNQNSNLEGVFMKAVMSFILPLIYLVVVSTFWMVIFTLKKIKKRPVKVKILFEIIFTSFIVILNNLYPILTLNFLNMFDCIRLDSNETSNYLRFSPKIKCYSDEHIQLLLIYALPYFIIWIVGFPLLSFIVLWKISQKKNQDRIAELKASSTFSKSSKILFEEKLDFSFMLNFLQMDYKSNFYYWAIVTFLWKIVMIVFIIFVENYLVFLLMMSFYLFLIGIYSHFKPYKLKVTHDIQIFSFFVNLLLACVGDFITSFPATNFGNFILILLSQIAFACSAILCFAMRNKAILKTSRILSQKLSMFRKKVTGQFDQSSSLRQLKTNSAYFEASKQVELSKIMGDKSLNSPVENKAELTLGRKEEIPDFYESVSEIQEERNFEDFKDMSLDPKSYFKKE